MTSESTPDARSADERPRRGLWRLAVAAILLALVLSTIAIIGARMVDEPAGPGGNVNEQQVEPGDRRN